MNKIRTVYLYTICLISLMMVFIGTISTVNNILNILNPEDNFEYQLEDKYEYKYEYKYDYETEEYLDNNIEEEVDIAEEIKIKRDKYIKGYIKDASTSGVVFVMGILLYSYYFKRLKKESMEV